MERNSPSVVVIDGPSVGVASDHGRDERGLVGGGDEGGVVDEECGRRGR
jgi:hypothetical protein